MAGEKSHSEIFVSGHLAQEKEEKGAPRPPSLNKKPSLGCSFAQELKSPDEDPNRKEKKAI